MTISYADKIPNNVDLGSDKMLQRALEHWQPEFLKWWADMGPESSHSADVYLRTAVSVHPSGWAHFDYVKMPEYRWGIFLSPGDGERKINFGDHLGEPLGVRESESERRIVDDIAVGSGIVRRNAVRISDRDAQPGRRARRRRACLEVGRERPVV